MGTKALLTDPRYRARVKAVKTLTESGWSVKEISLAVGVSLRQAKYDRKTIRMVKEAGKGS